VGNQVALDTDRKLKGHHNHRCTVDGEEGKKGRKEGDRRSVREDEQKYHKGAMPQGVPSGVMWEDKEYLGEDCVVDSLSKSINDDARDDRLGMNLSLGC
jgi:hypothetical protein